jgi:hypothetical protein
LNTSLSRRREIQIPVAVHGHIFSFSSQGALLPLPAL